MITLVLWTWFVTLNFRQQLIIIYTTNLLKKWLKVD